jgi:LysM repeat protein
MRNNFRPLYIVALVLVLFATLGLSSASAGAPVIHIVGWGDTLYSIAARYGTSVNTLMQANGLQNPNFIYIGQRLMISGNTAPVPVPATYVVQAGDTLFSISNRYGTSVDNLMRLNGLYNYWIYVGQTLRVDGQPMPVPPPVPQPQGVYHLVRPGDYLALIASRYGSSVYAIQIANQLPNPNFIWVGERLFIPGGQAPAFTTVYNPLPPIYPAVPPINVPVFLPPLVVVPPPVVAQPTAIRVTPVPPAAVSSSAASTTTGGSGTWEAVLNSQVVGTGPCALMVLVDGKKDWPVVVATTDGSWISDPKLTGTKPERSPYAVEFAHACTGVWRVIPLGLNIYADVEIKGGRVEIEFRQRP